MKIQIQLLAAAVALCLAGCAASSIEKKWKSPTFQGGPVQKIAVIAVDERGLVRKGFENRFVRDLGESGQAAAVTYDSLALPEIKSDKKAAADAMRSGG